MRVDEPVLEAARGVHRALAQVDQRIAIAESCTGGLVGAALTAPSGASDVFELGVISYSNETKHDVLGVPRSMLARTGAVSGPTARAMASGVRSLAGTSWGLSITGIAGPTGGRPGKPVGTVYIGIATVSDRKTISYASRFRFEGDRSSIRQQTTRTALERVASVIEEGEGHLSNGD